MKRNLKLVGLIFILVIIVVFPFVDKSPYHVDVIITLMMNAMLGAAFILLMRAGMLSLAVAAFWGIGSYVSAILATKFDVAVWLCFPLTFIITGVIAFILGLALLKNTGFSFVMLTAVIGMLFTTAVGNFQYFGGFVGISEIPRPETINLSFWQIDFAADKTPYYFLMLIIVIIIIVMVNTFNRTWTGRAWAGIGMNRRLAGSLGINVLRYKMIAFVLSSAITGLIGSYLAHYMTVIVPASYGIWKVVYIQIYAILGGVGQIFAGPFLGAGIMTILPELVRPIQNFGNIFVGIILILVITLIPSGLLSLPVKYREIKSKYMKKKTRKSNTV
ncbi:MAG: branched-chain amino acid ABC transporter permease [Dehalococcoidales bacterium]|nr:branched-chain amino acid ABC transporter permease [Dehalococcoidales bacterium]